MGCFLTNWIHLVDGINANYLYIMWAFLTQCSDQCQSEQGYNLHANRFITKYIQCSISKNKNIGQLQFKQQLLILTAFKQICSIMNLKKYSEYDSSEQQDEVNVNYFQRLRSLQGCRSVDAKKVVKATHDERELNQPQQEAEYQLKPKLNRQPQHSKALANNSAVSESSNLLKRRPLTAAYTFKLKTPVNKRKKNDPVSLFQQTSQQWKKDKFLTNRANNKEGRKLELDKRNKQLSKF